MTGGRKDYSYLERESSREMGCHMQSSKDINIHEDANEWV